MEILLFVLILDGLGLLFAYLVNSYDDIEIKDDKLIRSSKAKFKDDIIPSKIRGHKITTIGKSAFRSYRSERVIVSQGIKKIESESFYNCDNLSYVELPESIELIEDDAFTYRQLKKIKIHKNNQYYKVENDALLSKDGTILYHLIGNHKEYEIQDGVKVISKDSFYSTSLEKVTIPNGVEKIEKNAFSFTQLNEVNIPSSVNTIEDYAFSSNRLLGRINIRDKKDYNDFIYLGKEWNGNCSNIIIGGVYLADILKREKLKNSIEVNKQFDKYSDLIKQFKETTSNSSYENHCWRCRKHVSSRTNRQCPVCHWYICSCGACGPSCTEIDKR